MPKRTNQEREELVVENINNYIDDHKINIRTLANAMGLTYQQMYHKLYDRRSIDIITYFNLCDFFEVDYDYFMPKGDNK